jgi:hypothetical protein
MGGRWSLLLRGSERVMSRAQEHSGIKTSRVEPRCQQESESGTTLIVCHHNTNAKETLRGMNVPISRLE